MLEMEENIQNCLQCYRVCLRTFSHLLTLEPDAGLANPEQLHLLLVCADVCRMCAEFYAPLFRISPACREPVLCRFAGDPSSLGLPAGIDPCRTRVRLNMRGVTASAVRELYALPG